MHLISLSTFTLHSNIYSSIHPQEFSTSDISNLQIKSSSSHFGTHKISISSTYDPHVPVQFTMDDDAGSLISSQDSVPDMDFVERANRMMADVTMPFYIFLILELTRYPDEKTP